MVDSYGFIDSKAIEIQCFGLIISTANQREVTKTIFFYISTITADIWSKFGLHIGIAQ